MTGSGKTTQVPQFILENYIEHGMDPPGVHGPSAAGKDPLLHHGHPPHETQEEPQPQSFPHVPCVAVQGRCFPVTDHHLTEVRKLIGWRGPMDEETPDTHVDFIAEAVSYLAHSQPMGAILVFLPGWDDIMSVQDILKSKLRLPPHQYTLHLVHSMPSSGDQQQVFRVFPGPKCPVTGGPPAASVMSTTAWVASRCGIRVTACPSPRRWRRRSSLSPSNQTKPVPGAG